MQHTCNIHAIYQIHATCIQTTCTIDATQIHNTCNIDATYIQHKYEIHTTYMQIKCNTHVLNMRRPPWTSFEPLVNHIGTVRSVFFSGLIANCLGPRPAAVFHQFRFWSRHWRSNVCQVFDVGMEMVEMVRDGALVIIIIAYRCCVCFCYSIAVVACANSILQPQLLPSFIIVVGRCFDTFVIF
jgi:hypothetical protein